MIIHDVEQNSPEWFELRAGIPTASEFSNLVTSKGAPSKALEKYSYTLAAEAFTGGQVDAWEGNQYTDRGHELEAKAISAYEFMNDVEVTLAGFVTTDDGLIGCSPDGLIGDDGLIEIKCLGHKAHIETIIYYADKAAAPPKYFQQAQGQMMICDRKWCDLVFYYPTLPMLVIRQLPNKIFCESLALEIKTVVVRRDEILKVLQAM